MARKGSGDVAFLLVDGISILGSTTKITDSREDILEDNTPLGVAWEQWAAVGLGKGSFTQNGFYDSAADGANGALVVNTGAARVLCYGYEGNTAGEAFVGAAGAIRGKYTRIASSGKLTKANSEFSISGGINEGVILATLAARTTAGDTTSVKHDNAAESTAGGYAYLQVSALTLGGYTNAVVTVQDSANGTDWATIGTFAVRTAVGAERITIAGTIRRYTSITWAWTGAGTGQSITFTAGLARN